MASRAERATSFGAIAGDYDRLRAGPPQAAVSWLLPARCQTAVDLGAGTGLLTRALTGRVPEVIAVEPDARMRAVLAARSPGVRVVQGRGEDIPLPGRSADAVLVSSAWHWMEPEQAIPEIARVLRTGGRFGVLGTSHDYEVGWVRDLAGMRDGNAERDGAQRPRHEVTLPPGGLFAGAETALFTFTRAMTIDAIVDMLGTYSALITASPADRAAHLARARAFLLDRFPGTDLIDVPMRTRCWRADRTGKGAGYGEEGPA